ncbi:MAG: hypothetical protein Kow0022_04280 [Phycisphaerales bacterium]
MHVVLERAFTRFATLCAPLGAPLWRLTHVEHQVVSAPGSAINALVDSSEVVQRMRTLVFEREGGDEDQRIVSLSPGLLLLCVREVLHRRKFAWIVIPAPIDGQVDLASLGEAASLSPDQAGDVVAALHRAGVGDQEQAQARLRFLADVHRNCVEHLTSERTIVEFTDQLTTAYEYLTMFQRVGGLMGRLNEPAEFIQTVLSELLLTTQFRWIAFACAEDADDSLVHSGLKRFVLQTSEDLPVNEKQLEAGLREICQVVDVDATEPMILDLPPGLDQELGPEIVIAKLRDEDRCMGVLAMGARRGEDWAVSSNDTLPVQAVSACVSAYLTIIRRYQLERDSFRGTIEAFSAALDAKDPYTQGHSERVATLARQLAVHIGLDEPTCEQVYIAGLVHDIGKIGVPESVLCGRQRLTDEEFAILKTHPEVGERILRGIPLLAAALPGVRHHHERWDGRGYPAGLAGEEIPLMARILAVADSFDAMSSTRSYRPGQSRQRVLDELRRCAGQQFDPALVEAFMALDFGAYDEMLADAERALHSGADQSQAA